jgi:hypothetical protein
MRWLYITDFDHQSSSASVFDRKPERQRLAALRGSGKLGTLAARIEQGDSGLIAEVRHLLHRAKGVSERRHLIS